MIRFALIYDLGHGFEPWFSSGAAYEEQARRRGEDEGIRPCRFRGFPRITIEPWP